VEKTATTAAAEASVAAAMVLTSVSTCGGGGYGDPPPPSTYFGIFWQEKTHPVFSSNQNTSRINSFHLPSNEMTPMRMVTMVAICPIRLLWLAKL
jgi:hypothetical protein